VTYAVRANDYRPINNQSNSSITFILVQLEDHSVKLFPYIIYFLMQAVLIQEAIVNYKETED